MSQKQLKQALKTLFTAADWKKEGVLKPETFADFLRAVSVSLLRD